MYRLSPSELTIRYQDFERRGPSHVLPLRHAFDEQGIRGCRGALYVGLYPRKPFWSLEDFWLFQWFTSSCQQELLRTGKIDLDYFVPEPAVQAIDRFVGFTKNRTIEQSPPRPNRLDELGVAGWAQTLTVQSYVDDVRGGELDFTAACAEGYLTVFTVD